MLRHLETLIAEYLEWQGYLIRRNVKVGRRAKGGWEMELDVVGYHYKKKFTIARRYMFTELFEWLPPNTHIEQIAVFYNHPRGRDTIAGAKIMSVDELMAEIRAKVTACGPMISNAISEQYPLLRTIQMSHVGYTRAKF